MGGGRFYQDQKVKDWIEASLWELIPQKTKQNLKMITGPTEIKMLFECDMRSDIDNMASTVLDLLQKSEIIYNDRQVYFLELRRIKSKVPRIVILIEDSQGGDN